MLTAQGVLQLAPRHRADGDARCVCCVHHTSTPNAHAPAHEHVLAARAARAAREGRRRPAGGHTQPLARPAHGPGRASSTRLHSSSCWLMPIVRSHARAHPCARSSTAHLPVAQTVSRPSISSFMTSSAMARRALTLYADPGGSQHRVVQHHEQQLGQPEHGGGINAEGKWRARRRRSTHPASRRALRSCVQLPARPAPARSW